MRRQLRAAGRRVVALFVPTAVDSVSTVPGLREELQQANHHIRELQDRVARLENEMQEAHRLNRRIAEVTDIVQEVLLPAADRDDDRLKHFLTRYADSF